jgi:hypothetical protein
VRTDQILGWPGGQFHVGFADSFGTRLSEGYIGNGFPVQLADVADRHPRLTYLYYTQSVLEDRLSIKAFPSVGIDLVPLGLFFNAPGAFGYPDTTWGAPDQVPARSSLLHDAWRK